VKLAKQDVITGEICGPVLVKVEGFEYVGTEVLFVDMQAVDDEYEPLLGHLVLEHCGAAVDMERGTLVPVRYIR
jgi:hypothetical protein